MIEELPTHEMTTGVLALHTALVSLMTREPLGSTHAETFAGPVKLQWPLLGFKIHTAVCATLLAASFSGQAYNAGASPGVNPVVKIVCERR